MLKKQYRLPAVVRLTHPYSFTTDTFFVKVANNNLSYSRFGFVVKKSIDKRATVRNRIRRRFRSCIEEMRGSMKQGKDFLFFLKASILEIQHEELYNKIQTALKEKNLL